MAEAFGQNKYNLFTYRYLKEKHKNIIVIVSGGIGGDEER